ncbi:MAG: TlpA disulfide reductase family protein [Bacteroidia bacterium]
MYLIRILTLSVVAIFCLNSCDGDGNNENREYDGFEKKYDGEVQQNSDESAGNQPAPTFTDGSSENVVIYGKTEGQLDLPNNPNLPGRKLEGEYLDFVIEGYLFNGANLELIIDELDGTSINPLQTTVVNEDDYFRFEGSHKAPTLYQLRTPTGVIHLLVVSGNIMVETTYPRIGDYTLSGGGATESQHLLEMYNLLNLSNEKAEAIQQRMDNLTNNKLIIQMYDSLPIINAEVRNFKSRTLKEFIREIDKSLVAPLTAMRLDVATNIDFLDSLNRKFNKLYPGNQFVRQLDDKISPYIMTAAGKDAPNIVLQTQNEKPLELKSLRGKLVLIDFWASWCKPCRAQNPDMVKMYQRYHNRGFEIYGVSFDKDKDEWRQAIKEDGLPWVQVNDPLGLEESPLVNVYLISGIPKTILVDRDGKIVAKDLPKAELEQAIKKYL